MDRYLVMSQDMMVEIKNDAKYDSIVYVKEKDVNMEVANAVGKVIFEKNKEIEQLKKEKGWLEYKVLEASQKQYPELSLAEKVAMLEDDMQQALKEK